MVVRSGYQVWMASKGGEAKQDHSDDGPFGSENAETAEEQGNAGEV